MPCQHIITWYKRPFLIKNNYINIRKGLTVLRKNILTAALLASLLLLLPSCGMQQQADEKPSYEETKKMVVDILKTDEGKKAIQEVLQNEEMKQVLIMEQDLVKKTIQDSLISEDGHKNLQKIFSDPEFLVKYAKSLQKEHEEIIKGLMKDPEYQKMLLDILQDPEMQKSIQNTIKSQEFRKHLQEVILETMESPLFKAKIDEAVLKAAKEALKETGKSSGDENQQEDHGSSSH